MGALSLRPTGSGSKAPIRDTIPNVYLFLGKWFISIDITELPGEKFRETVDFTPLPVLYLLCIIF